jgi:two-component system, OmpR family, phosphate regulon sensor histidine kinase PhoR
MKSPIWAAQLLAVLLAGALLLVYQGHTLQRYLSSTISEHLQKEARLSADLSASNLRDLRREAPAMVLSIGQALKARATIVQANGAVVGDSEIPPTGLDTMDNHGGRPEIRDALLNGEGSSIRYSETLRTDMLYQAVRFRTAAGEIAVLRLALPLAARDAAVTGLQPVLILSLLLALLLILANYLFSAFTARSLREMTATAARFGNGEPGARLIVEKSSELGQLSGVLNEVAVRIEGELARTKAERNRLNAILRGMGEGIMVADASGSITLVNPAFKSLFEPANEVEGKPLIDISRHPALHDTFRQVIATKAERVEELVLRNSGEKTVLTHWVPLMEGGVLQGVVVVFHDISEIRRLENIRKDFVANVSHELRTPITIIKGYAETLMSGGLENPEQALRFVSIIVSHAERLGALVGDLLTLSQLESGNMSLETRSVNIPQLAGHVVSLLEQKSHEKGIRVDASRLAEAPLVLADPGRLEQIFVNLLDNAIKYTPAGGTVSMSATIEGNLVRIGVHDTGIGIPSRDLSRIFERFYRVDTARSRDEGGTGLGLSIVKHLVQMQGGTVSVQSSGQGSSFFFTLRRFLVAAKPQEETASVGQASSAASPRHLAAVK